MKKNLFKSLLVALMFILSGDLTAGQPDKSFNAVVSFNYELNGSTGADQATGFNDISTRLAARVNELTRNRKFAILFPASDSGAGSNMTPDIYLEFSIQFSGNEQNTAEVYYSDENDHAFRSIKYANMVVSEMKSSRLNLKINGMVESEMDNLKNAAGPALQVVMNMAGAVEGNAMLADEEKLDAMARMIYNCIERIYRS